MITHYKYINSINGFITIALPRAWKANGSVPGVVLSPTTTENRLFPFDSSTAQPTIKRLTDAGFPVACVTPLNQWGNSNARSWITTAKNLLQSEYGAKPGKIGLVGISQGTVNVFSWAAVNQSSTGYVAAFLPVTDLTKVAAMQEFQSSLSEAYPSGPMNDPLEFAKSGVYDLLNIDLIYAPDDNMIQKSWIDEFSAESGAQVINGGFHGHTWNITYPEQNIKSVIQNLHMV